MVNKLPRAQVRPKISALEGCFVFFLRSANLVLFSALKDLARFQNGIPKERAKNKNTILIYLKDKTMKHWF
jgi:hypothetical protein